MKVPKVKCRVCNGAGEIKIAPHLFDTLECVRRLNNVCGVACSDAVHELIGNGIGLTAIINRLDDLYRLGLLNRKKNGRSWEYTVK